MENDYSPCRHSLAVMDRCSRIINRKFSAAPAAEDAIWSESDGPVQFDCRSQWTFAKFACGAVDNFKYLFNGLTCGLGSSPTGDLLRDNIQVRNTAFIVSTDDGITNGIECDLSTFLLDE